MVKRFLVFFLVLLFFQEFTFYARGEGRLNLDLIEKTTIKISWVDNSSNEDSFRIWRAEKTHLADVPRDEEWQIIANVPANTTSYTDRNLKPGKTYWYMVRAHFPSGGWSTIIGPASKTTGYNVVITEITMDPQVVAPDQCFCLWAKIRNNHNFALQNIQLRFFNSSGDKRGYIIGADITGQIPPGETRIGGVRCDFFGDYFRNTGYSNRGIIATLTDGNSLEVACSQFYPLYERDGGYSLVPPLSSIRNPQRPTNFGEVGYSKPDLTIQNLTITEIQRDNQRVKLRITVTIKNNTNGPTDDERSLTPTGRVNNKNGYVTVSLGATDDINQQAIWSFPTIHTHTFSAMKGQGTKSFDYEEWVSSSQRKYGAIVDHMKWIDETDENNNSFQRVWRK
jgi:hypothetical protein